MKKLSAYILVICFIFQSSSQLWIITHFYIQRDYIADNLCVNRFDESSDCKGCCYLKKELKENEQQQEKRLPDLKQKEIQFFAVTAFDLKLNPVYGLFVVKILAAEQGFFSSEFIHSVFHPPRQA